MRTLLSGAEQAARTILADNERSLRSSRPPWPTGKRLTASDLAELHLNGVHLRSGFGLVAGAGRTGRRIIDLALGFRLGSDDREGIEPERVGGAVGGAVNQPHGRDLRRLRLLSQARARLAG